MTNIKDGIEKEYFKDNDIFSNLANYYLFNGKKIISPEDLKELDTEYNITNPNIINRKRDIIKIFTMKTDGKNKYLLLGIENQTKVDYKMVTRCMLYDTLSYVRQIDDIDISRKNDKIKLNKNNNYLLSPVITIVIYFSHKKWNAKKDLYSMLDISDDLILQYVSNYKLNIIEPYNMTEKDFNMLDNDLSILFEFIKNSGNKEKLINLINNNKKYGHVNKKTIRLINEVTNINITIEEDKEEIDMCKAIEDLKKDARKGGKIEGIAEGKKEGLVEGEAKKLNENIKTMYKNGFDVETIARALSLDIVFVKKALI